MALPVIATELVAPTRDEWRDKYLRSYALRDPLADTGPDTQPYIDASGLADILVIQSENAKRGARGVLLAEATGARLDQRGAERGIPRQLETGASGFVAISASITGTHIYVGDVLIDANADDTYACTVEADYVDGGSVPVAAISKGSKTNRDPAATLVWSAPRPGCFPTATVVALADGSGLSGGRETEDDDTYRQRIADAQANPAASGNDAEYQCRTENASGHGVPVQKAFTYPAIFGPGTTAVAFTLLPGRSGASRRPNGTQISTVQSYVLGFMPADDSPAFITILAQAKSLTMKVKWLKSAPGWADAVQWPPLRLLTDSPGPLEIQSATDPLNFIIRTTAGGYAGIAAPQVGQTIGIFDVAAPKFRRKKILSFTGTGPWTIVCDGTNNASDTAYTPVTGDRPCPWSDSLDSLIPPILAAFDKLGPGEQVAVFYDEGRRQRRNPESPGDWPAEITDRVLDDIFNLPAVFNARFADDPTGNPTVGVPGISVNIFELSKLSVFPL